MRTALLAAVGHDLRTPAGIGEGGRHQPAQRRRDWSPEDRDELLETADESLDRLAAARGQPARHEPAAGRARSTS